MALVKYIVLLSASLQLVTPRDPFVTLSHGGQLRGKRIIYNNIDIDLFLGVRYAKAPVGNLRFKKPEALDPWTGVKDARHVNSMCVQTGAAELSGKEDCLFLGINVPNGVNASRSSRKPVMVYIHGGGYTTGSGSIYIGAPLAVTGDVIIVTLNYRLGILGFLSDGPGTGNFGLWDQRAALVWVKENIAQFGGDPDMVTIFGESAGASSVACQLMGKHNGGLFRRAIQQSGSVYPDWGWFVTSDQRYKLVTSLKVKTNCVSSKSVYECLDGKTPEDLVSLAVSSTDLGVANYWVPVPDEDFFFLNITNEDYDLPGLEEVDLLAGFNSQEGGLALTYTIMAITARTNQPVTGFSMDLTKQALEHVCFQWVPLSVDLCVGFVLNAYQLKTAPNDQERGIRLSYFMGESSFVADIVRQLSSRSLTSTTYAYYFTEFYRPPVKNRLWDLPDWARVGAEHADDLIFVWGAYYSQQNLNYLTKEYFGDPLPKSLNKLIPQWFGGPTEAVKPLTDLMMRAWTNFAKSGNPNLPVSLPAGTPTWPQFKPNTQQLMELNSTNLQVITTPHKERLELLTNTLFSSRTKQKALDKAPEDCKRSDAGKLGKSTDDVFG